MSTTEGVLITVGIILIVTLLCFIGYYKQRIRDLRDEFQMELETLEEDYEQTLDKEIEKALNKSKTVIRGSVSEEFAPLLKGFPYQMSDCKFSGQPLDYVVFNGMSGLRDDKEGKIEIVFADVKSGKATLNTVQRRIRDAINEKRVRFETWIIENGEFKIK